MFDHKHYVPILRWKQAERIALKKLSSEDKAGVTPLVEIPPGALEVSNASGTVGVDQGLSKVAEEVLGSWGEGKLFLDLGLVDHGVRASGSAHPVTALFDAGRSLYPSFIPVTTLGRDLAYQKAVGSVIARDELGICLRLRGSELRRPGLADEIYQLLGRFDLKYENVDLLVDYGVVAENPPNLTEVCELLPALSRWRTFTVASGAFPKNLTAIRPPGEHMLSRRDWLAWRDQVTTSPPLSRLPSFSDYTIQHPIYDPPIYDNGPPNVSASIRYAAEDYWVIMRGEGIRNDDGPGPEQWPANAMLLRERSEFSGSNFSYGDRYIEEMADNMENGGPPKNGNSTTWLRAGLNRHLTLTVRQIANLFDSSVDGAPST